MPAGVGQYIIIISNIPIPAGTCCISRGLLISPAAANAGNHYASITGKACHLESQGTSGQTLHEVKYFCYGTVQHCIKSTDGALLDGEIRVLCILAITVAAKSPP